MGQCVRRGCDSVAEPESKYCRGHAAYAFPGKRRVVVKVAAKKCAKKAAKKLARKRT